MSRKRQCQIERTVHDNGIRHAHDREWQEVVARQGVRPEPAAHRVVEQAGDTRPEHQMRRRRECLPWPDIAEHHIAHEETDPANQHREPPPIEEQGQEDGPQHEGGKPLPGEGDAVAARHEHGRHQQEETQGEGRAVEAVGGEHGPRTHGEERRRGELDEETAAGRLDFPVCWHRAPEGSDTGACGRNVVRSRRNVQASPGAAMIRHARGLERGGVEHSRAGRPSPIREQHPCAWPSSTASSETTSPGPPGWWPKSGRRSPTPTCGSSSRRAAPSRSLWTVRSSFRSSGSAGMRSRERS